MAMSWIANPNKSERTGGSIPSARSNFEEIKMVG